jgi:hypothetical protein
MSTILVLSEKQKEDIFVFIKKAFSDFVYFDELVADPVKRLINESSKHHLDFNFTKTLLERYVAVDKYLSKDQKDILEKIRIILFATAVHLYSLSSSADVLIFNSIDQLVKEYPDLTSDLDPVTREEDKTELDFLLTFRNYMMCALKLITAKGNKLFLLRVIERLEGSNNEYITGTGQKPSVSRRVGIYHKEGEVVIVKKAPKSVKSKSLSENIDAVNELPVKVARTSLTTNCLVSSVISSEISFDKIFSDPDSQHCTSFTAAGDDGLIPSNSLFLMNEPYSGCLTEEVMAQILGKRSADRDG